MNATIPSIIILQEEVPFGQNWAKYEHFFSVSFKSYDHLAKITPFLLLSKLAKGQKNDILELNFYQKSIQLELFFKVVFQKKYISMKNNPKKCFTSQNFDSNRYRLTHPSYFGTRFFFPPKLPTVFGYLIPLRDHNFVKSTYWWHFA